MIFQLYMKIIGYINIEYGLNFRIFKYIGGIIILFFCKRKSDIRLLNMFLQFIVLQLKNRIVMVEMCYLERKGSLLYVIFNCVLVRIYIRYLRDIDYWK